MNNKIAKNTIMLYIMTFSKMLFPLLTLPYLTRVLSIDGYAIVSYVKSTMVYVQIFLDFGFLLSATKDIVKAGGDKDEINRIIGDTVLAKVLLALVCFVIIIIVSFCIPILRENLIYTLLAFVSISLTILLPDFLFRGIEKMEVITIRFVIMRGISTVLTFLVIKSDMQLILIPVLDIIGTTAALIWAWFEVKKLHFKPVFTSIARAITSLKQSFIYFLSDASTTVFGALNTVLIGIFLTKQDISFWSVAMQLISAGQSMYSPINNGIYPHMVREKNIKLPLKIFAFLMPVVFLGTAFCFICGEWIIVLISGEKYREAVIIFRWLLPLLILSFPSMLFGWPCLGAIEKPKAVTISTVTSATVQILLLIALIITGCFELRLIAIARIISECILLSMRVSYCFKYKNDFNGVNVSEQ